MRTILLPLPFLLLAKLLPAQDGVPRQLAPFLTPIHTQADDPEGGAYGIWGAGADYKASFHDGATFVPYLGGDYPVTQTWRWRTTSVTVGTTELATRERPLGRQVSDTRYEYDLGAVVEAYDLQLDGLEQTFVVRQVPGDGDLVVHAVVQTALHAEPCAARHGPVVFADAQGTAILGYGAATAIDAAGRRSAMTTRYADGVFELRLDGGWLREAALPVTVDPLTYSFAVATWSGSFGQSSSCDTYFDKELLTAPSWFAYTRQVSAVDSDLWVVRPTGGQQGIALVMFADVTTTWGNDSCALAPTSDRVVCAFGRVFPGTLPTRNVRWHVHHRDDFSARTGYGSWTASTNNWRVDLGGGQGPLLVVFQHETGLTFGNGADSQIRAFRIDPPPSSSLTGQGTAAYPFTIFAGATVDCERPRTGKNSVVDTHCVAYQWLENQVANDDWDVQVDYWTDTGTLRGRIALDPADDEHKLGPVVSGNERTLVTYAKAPVALVPGPTASIAGYSITTQRVDYDPFTATVTLPHPANPYLTSSTRSLEAYDSAYDGATRSHWLQLIRDGNVLYVDQIGYTGQWVSFDILFTGTSVPATYPVSAGVSWTGFDGQFTMVHSAFQSGTQPITGSSWGQNGGVAPKLEGLGCSSAVPGWFGGRLIGSEFTRLTLTGLPPNWPAAAAISFGTANVPLGGIAGFGSGCTLLLDPAPPNYVGLLPGVMSNVVGEAQWSLPLPESLPPGWLYFQALHPDASWSALLVTQRLGVLLIY